MDGYDTPGYIGLAGAAGLGGWAGYDAMYKIPRLREEVQMAEGNRVAADREFKATGRALTSRLFTNRMNKNLVQDRHIAREILGKAEERTTLATRALSQMEGQWLPKVGIAGVLGLGGAGWLAYNNLKKEAALVKRTDGHPGVVENTAAGVAGVGAAGYAGHQINKARKALKVHKEARTARMGASAERVKQNDAFNKADDSLHEARNNHRNYKDTGMFATDYKAKSKLKRQIDDLKLDRSTARNAGDAALTARKEARGVSREALSAVKKHGKAGLLAGAGALAVGGIAAYRNRNRNK